MDRDKECNLSGLIQEVRLGDDSAFAALAERYAPMLNKVASGFVSPSFAHNEAYSEACVAFHRAALSYDFDRSDVTFGLYARICVYRHLCDIAAKAAKDSCLVELDMDTISIENTVEARIVERERVKEYTETAKTLLSEYEYRVFLLYIDGYSTAQIADRLERSAKSVDNAKARMFKTLREHSRKFSDI